MVDLLARPLTGSGDDALALLGIGLNSAPASHSDFRDYHRGQGVRLGPKPETLTVPTKPGTTSFTIVRTATAAERADEHICLCGRTTFAPMPIWLDGRRLDGRSDSPFYRGFARPAWAEMTLTTSDLVLGEAVGAGTGLTIRGCRPAVMARNSLLEPTGAWNPSTFLLLVEHREPVATEAMVCGSYVLIPLALTGDGEVSVVQYGVILETRTVGLACGGARAAVSVDGWPTDLGGFQLRDPEAIEQELRDARNLCALLSGTLRKASSRLPLALTEKDSTLQSGFTGTLVGLGLGLLFGPTPALAAGVTAAGGVLGLAGGWLSSVVGVHRRRAAQLQEEILKRLTA
ncbi:MAG: hypothetical protein HY319_09860 [Armatimonadetes bacterium]|nr:hypothetical protein [Armatimonadota bacterium]